MSRLISQKDLSQFVRGRPKAFFVVYADWCPACHHLFETLGVPFKKGSPAPNVFPDVRFAEVDTVEEALKPHAFPDVRMFVGGVEKKGKDLRQELRNYVESLHSEHGSEHEEENGGEHGGEHHDVEEYLKNALVRLALNLRDCQRRVDELTAEIAELGGEGQYY